MKSTNNKGAAMIEMTVDQFDVGTKRVVIVRHDESERGIPEGYPFAYYLYEIGEDCNYEGNVGWDTADGARQAALDAIEWMAAFDAKESR
jgi:hypothetical protein